MNLVVVGLLIGLWAWVLLPGLLRQRRHTSEAERGDTSARVTQPADATDRSPSRSAGLGRHVLVLGDPERVVTSRARSRAELRRRAMLARGGFLVAVAVGGGFFGGGLWWTPGAVLGAIYLMYVAMVVRLEQRLSQQREMLHDLAEEREKRQQPEPVVVDDAIEVAVGDDVGIIVTGWTQPTERG